jgi:hypothetical protein
LKFVDQDILDDENTFERSRDTGTVEGWMKLLMLPSGRNERMNSTFNSSFISSTPPITFDSLKDPVEKIRL